jgi:hypothetical protein
VQIESKKFKVKSYEVYNVYGQNVKQLKTCDSKFIIKVADFSKGIYFIKLQTEQGVLIRKFIKN